MRFLNRREVEVLDPTNTEPRWELYLRVGTESQDRTLCHSKTLLSGERARKLLEMGFPRVTNLQENSVRL